MNKKELNISLIVFDFDGVLTDNRVLVFDDGREAVCCNRADGLAFDLFRREGFPALILSTEKNPVVAPRKQRLGAGDACRAGTDDAMHYFPSSQNRFQNGSRAAQEFKRI